MELKDKCAIVGVGKSPQGKVPSMNAMSLGLIAVKKAIEDAGLTTADIDGILCEKPLFGSGLGWTGRMAAALGIPSAFTSDLGAGGSTCMLAGQLAAMAINAGIAHNIVCVFCDSVSNPLTTERPRGDEFTAPHGHTNPVFWWAMAWQRYMHDYGYDTTPLAHVAVATRKWANMNPEAQMYGKPLAIEDHQNARYLVEPLRVADCCLMSDGASAYVVTSAERAKDLKHPPIYISGFGQSTGYEFIFHRYSDIDPGGGIRAGERAYRMAGLGPKDMDVVELYDGFTPLVIHELESYGFCKLGEGGEFVKGCRIEPGGEFPLNTHGGLLSEAYMVGWNHIIEAVRQLRGDCGDRQVRDAEVAFVSGYGGGVPSLHYGALILTRR